MRGRVWLAAFLLLGCKGSSVTLGDAGVAGLSLTLVSRADASVPLYPYDPAGNDANLRFTFRATVTNTGAELQDLRLVLPVPESLKNYSLPGTNDYTKPTGGIWGYGALRAAAYDFDWLPPEVGSQKIDFTVLKSPSPFSDDSQALHGEITVSMQAMLLQYGQTLAATPYVTYQAYLPIKLASMQFDLGSSQSAQVDGDFVYLAARSRSGDNAGKGGVYRVTISGDAGELDGGNDEKVTMVARHAARQDQIAPFVVDGDYVYYVTYDADDGKSVVRRIAKDGSGDAGLVALPSQTRTVISLATDPTYLFTVVQRQNNSYVLQRCAKDDCTQDMDASSGLPGVVSNNIAVTTSYVFVMQDNPPAIIRFAKDSLVATKLVDVGSSTGGRSLACDDQYCFWTEWYDGWLFQIQSLPPDAGAPEDAGLDGGADGGVDAGAPVDSGIVKMKLTSTNQPIVYDGSQIYSGINGIVRVGPNQRPAGQTLFQSSPLPLFGTDANYLYFGYDGRVWRIHK